MNTNRPQGRIPELDGIRGIAILLVMVMHYFYFYPAANHHPHGLIRNLYVAFERCIAIGWCGVDLFFVLSGFLIGGILLDARSSPSYFQTFYLRRFFRIVPIYYLWITLYAVIVLLSLVVSGRSEWLGAPTKWHEIGAQYLFFQNLGLVHYWGWGGAWLGATWSLAVEEQFYLVVPFVIRVFSSRALRRFLVSVIVLAPIARLAVHYWVQWPGLSAAYVLMPCRADGLAMGMLLALLWRREQARNWLFEKSSLLYAIFGVLLAGVVAMDLFSSSHDSVVTQTAGFSWLALFFAVMIALALTRPEGPIASLARTKWLREFGGVSYCLYIIHLAVNQFCQSLFSVTEKTSNWRVIAAPTLAVGLAYSLAKLSWVYFERPLLARGHAFKYEDAQPTNAAPVLVDAVDRG
jgi:peptidoglycan/LPS O-acetylase OafA/YrhL